ncbi:MAG: peptide chain release factor-like protein [Phycisphaerales bacterium]|nr:peptide chain release factor-like protein [Phycisphaerales bacterium]
MGQHKTHDGASDRDSLLLDDAALLLECEFDTYRARGPGGQKRNKTDSAVRLRHRPSGLMAIAVETRSQHQNKAHALRRLRHALAVQVRRLTSISQYEPSAVLARYVRGSRSGSPVEADSRSPGAQAERKEGAACLETPDPETVIDAGGERASPARSAGGALSINEKNPEYAQVLREVLDVLFACDLRAGEAAKRLGITTSQLIKFLRKDTHAWGHVNQQRAQRGEPALR